MIKNRKIINNSLISEIKKDIEMRVMQDWEVDIRSKNHYKFHFVSSYIFSHVTAGFFDEFMGDKIMEYVNDNMSLFLDEY